MGCAGLQGMSSTPTRVRRRVEEGPSEIPCRVRKLALLSREGQRRPAHIGEALPAGTAAGNPEGSRGRGPLTP